jgi:T-complex protein 1 subunit eta
MIVKRAAEHTHVVGGGGSIEMELSKHLRQYARTIKSKMQMIISAYAKALEVIPRQLAENAGFDSNDILNELRAEHAAGNTWCGVDIENGGTTDMMDLFVYEPVMIKQNALSAATEAALTVLSVDETIKSADANDAPDDSQMAGPGMQQLASM